LYGCANPAKGEGFAKAIMYQQLPILGRVLCFAFKVNLTVGIKEYGEREFLTS
jgi:hypothetical protein